MIGAILADSLATYEIEPFGAIANRYALYKPYVIISSRNVCQSSNVGTAISLNSSRTFSVWISHVNLARYLSK